MAIAFGTPDAPKKAVTPKTETPKPAPIPKKKPEGKGAK